MVGLPGGVERSDKEISPCGLTPLVEIRGMVGLPDWVCAWSGFFLFFFGTFWGFFLFIYRRPKKKKKGECL